MEGNGMEREGKGRKGKGTARQLRREVKGTRRGDEGREGNEK